MIEAIEANDKKDKRHPVDILLSHLKALGDALVRAKDNQPEKEILQEIYSLTDTVKWKFSSIEDKLTIINHNNPNTTANTPSSAILPKPTYASVLKHSNPPLIPTKNTHEVIIKLHDKDIVTALQS